MFFICMVSVCIYIYTCFSFIWFVGFYDISTFVGYLPTNPFYVNNRFYLKQFSLARVQGIIVKNISI